MMGAVGFIQGVPSVGQFGRRGFAPGSGWAARFFLLLSSMMLFPISSIVAEEFGIAHNLVHQLADITNTSTALGIFNGALARACLLFRKDFLQYRGPAVETDILLDVGCGISKAVTYQFFHRAVLQLLLFTPSSSSEPPRRSSLMKPRVSRAASARGTFLRSSLATSTSIPAC